MRHLRVRLAVLGLVGATGLVVACEPSTEGPSWMTSLSQNPEDGSHHAGRPDPFYEGWYHRVTATEDGEAFFFIYGVINPSHSSASPSHAFLYCGRATTLTSVYQELPIDQYSAEELYRDVRIGPTARATAGRFTGEVDDGVHRCVWDVETTAPRPWPSTMGGLTDIEGFETKWAVGNLRSDHVGWVRFDDRTYRLDGSPGYADHNWGSVFPRRWFWMQAAFFPEEDTALAASGGTVPVGDREYEAAMVGFRAQGRLFVFRSQDLDRMSFAVEQGRWQVDGARELERIHVEGRCDPDTRFNLLVPTLEGMKPRARESLLGTVDVTLESRATPTAPWTVAYRGRSSWAGVEAGD